MKILKMFKSLQTRIFLIIFVLLFVPVALLLNYNFTRSESVLRDNTSKLILSNLEQIGLKIDNVAEDIMKISSMVSSNSVILSSLSGYGHKNIDAFESKNLEYLGVDDVIKISEVQKQIYYVKNNFFNYISHILLFGADGNLYCSLDTVYDEFEFKLKYIKEYRKQSWYQALKSGETLGVWTTPFNYEMPGSDQRFISLARVIKDNLSQDILGIIMVNFSEENFRRYLGNDANGIVTLLNQNKEVIFSDSKDYQSTGAFEEAYARIPNSGTGSLTLEVEGKEYLANYYSMKRNGWSLVSLLPYSEVMKEIESLKTTTYLINLCIFGAFFIIAIGLILHITNPLKELIWKIRRMKIGEHSLDLRNMEYSDDVSGIVMSFEYMIKRVEELVSLVIQEQKYESDLKYEALRAQINPHFLFNTLSIIKWSAMMSGSENVARMISALGKLLEVSMNKGDDEITLREELDLAQSYVYIQNIRFNDSLTLICETDEVLGELKVLKLILQPIIENSIFHGFKEKTSGAIIHIRAAQKDDKLILVVKDNGSGISQDKIESILNDHGPQKHKFSSIGLINIHERLKIKYGSDFGLSIQSEAGKGTEVTVILPVIR